MGASVATNLPQIAGARFNCDEAACFYVTRTPVATGAFPAGEFTDGPSHRQRKRRRRHFAALTDVRYTLRLD